MRGTSASKRSTASCSAVLLRGHDFGERGSRTPGYDNSSQLDSNGPVVSTGRILDHRDTP